MKLRITSAVLSAGIVFFMLPAACYADSSWHWLTISPMTLLPLAVIFTLLIETFSVVRFGGVTNTKKALLVTGLANLLSFLAPYIERANRFRAVTGGFYLPAAFDRGPYYMVFSGFLLLTLIVELPVVYLLLRKNTSEKGNLLLSIILSNIATTVLVAFLERLLCIGSW